MSDLGRLFFQATDALKELGLLITLSAPHLKFHEIEKQKLRLWWRSRHIRPEFGRRGELLKRFLDRP